MRQVLATVVLGCGGTTPNTKAPEASSTIVVLERAPADAVALDVRAFRWSCDITYPTGTVDKQLRVPVGRAVKLAVWTPEHPGYDDGIEVALLGTDVAVAVRHEKPVEIAFRVDSPGTYRWRCPTILPDVAPAEPVQLDPVKPFVAVPAPEFDAWLAANDSSDPANQLAHGRKLYETKGCVSCHTLDGSPRVGPSWAGLWGSTVTLADGTRRVVDEIYIKHSVLEPNAFARPGYPPVMPSFEGQLQPAQLDAIVAFIKSLANAASAP